MSDTAPQSRGVVASVSAAAALALEMLETRLALLATELEEQGVRLARVMVLAGLALLGLAMTLVLAVAALVVYFWDTHRLAVLVGLAALALVVSALLCWQIRRSLVAMPGLFSASLEALRKDRAGLRR